MVAEVYHIGVAIAMSSNASEVLGVIARDLLGLGRQAKALESELGHVRTTALGAMIAIGNTAILRGMGRLIEAAKDLNHQLALMKSAGMPDFSIAAASATAWKVAGQVPGSTASGNARSLRELRLILGTPDEAAAALPDFARAAVVLSSVSGKSQADAIRMLAQALELRGGITNPATGQVSAAQFSTELNLALKAIIISAGLVDQQQLRDIMHTAGPMPRMIEPATFYRLMMTAIMDVGGVQAGTALSAAGRQLNGGIMQPRNKEEMERLGLVDPSKGHMTRGRIVTDPHFLIGEDILNGPGGLFAWVQKILHPRLEKMLLPDLKAPGLEGVALAEALNQAEQAELYRVGSSQSFGSLLGFFLQQEQPMLRGQTLFEKAVGLAAYPQLMGTASPRDGRRDSNSYGPPPGEGIYSDPTSKIVAFEAAWKNLLTALDSPLVNDATNLLGKLTTELNTLAALSARYPNLMGGLEEFAAVLAGLVALGGSLAVLNSGLRVLGALLPTFGYWRRCRERAGDLDRSRRSDRARDRD